MLHTLISLFTIFLYTALGTYVLTKNPHERTNKVFALLMLAFILWAVGTYNLGLIVENAPFKEVVWYMKLQLSGVIVALTLFVFFALAVARTDNAFKNPLTYIIIIPSIYLLYIIWTSDASHLEGAAFPAAAVAKPELFLFSTIFGVAGIYLLLRHYMASKYRERKQAKLILAGAMAAILIAVVINIILPMFFDRYFLSLSTLAPAVMGVFFAYAVYQHGFFIRAMPEISVTSFCGVECTLCPEYLDDNCLGCRFDRERYTNCEIYNCVKEKGYKDCGDCPEIIECVRRRETSELCFRSKLALPISKYCVEPGNTYFVKGNGYSLFLDEVKCGAFGLVATTAHPKQVKEKYGLTTTPIVWVSEEAAEMGAKPGDIKRLSMLLMNFMRKIGNAVILLDGIDTLIGINGFEDMQRIVQILNSVVRTTNSRFIIITDLEGETLDRLKQGMEYIKLDSA